MSIRKKIVFYAYAALIPILLVICLLITAYRCTEARKEYEQIQENSIGTVAASLDIIQKEIHHLSLNMAINRDIRNILSASKPEALKEDPNLWMHETPVQMIEEIVALKGYIKTLSIYPENGVMPYLRCMDSASYVSGLEQIRDSEVYQAALKGRGEGIWIRAGRGESAIYQENNVEKLVLCREAYDLSKKKPLGFITIGIDAGEVQDLCENVLQNGGEGVLLLNHLGDEIGRYGVTDEKISAYVKEKELFKEEQYHGIFERKEIFQYKMKESGCCIIKIAPQKVFGDFLGEIIYIPLALMLGVTFGLLPVLLLVSNIISKPLAKLCGAMEKFGEGDFEQRLEIKSEDEVGRVTAGFNQMVKVIEQLINKNYIMVLKERESELAALQAQINPHFLYNALDSIYWQALGADDEEAAESIYQLSQLFRLVLGRGEKLVTVEMELELSKRYLEIQRLRFQQQMEFRLEVDPEILSEKIPKLILQPFVENAVVHGMQKDDVCVITISGTCVDERMEFQISDTGIGMTEEQIKRLWEEDADKVFTGQRIGKYAIKNVRERLELEYGKEFQLEIRSKVGEGTEVTLVLPRKTEEEEDGTEITDSRG